jgi:hypothetical protein
MRMYRETALRKQADGPTAIMLDLWRRLTEEKTGQPIEVMVGHRKEHQQLRDFSGELNTAWPDTIDGRVVLVLWLDSLTNANQVIVTHELGHWILKLQGFRGFIHTRQKRSNIEILLNSMAHHPPLYHLQRSVGHEPQDEINSRCESSIRRFSKNKETKSKELWKENALFLSDDLLNCSSGNRTGLENVIRRQHNETWKLVTKVLELAQCHSLVEPRNNKEFCDKVIEELELGDGWESPDEEEELRIKVKKTAEIRESENTN